MKVGIRTPSVQKRVKARTTGRIKREVKGSINPLYGKKGMGYIKDPERALKNKMYHKLTVDPLKAAKHITEKGTDADASYDAEYVPEYEYEPEGRSTSEKVLIFTIICLLIYYGIRLVLFLSGSGSFPAISLIIIIVLGIVYYRI